MIAKQRRYIPAPCIVCLHPIHADDRVWFCPDCGEPYHSHCWKNIGKRCKIFGCHGRTYNLWLIFEYPLLSILEVNKSNLVAICPYCKESASFLDRFCIVCGYKKNGMQARRTFWAYPFAKWLQRNNRIIAVLIAILLFLSVRTITNISTSEFGNLSIINQLLSILGGIGVVIILIISGRWVFLKFRMKETPLYPVVWTSSGCLISILSVLLFIFSFYIPVLRPISTTLTNLMSFTCSVAKIVPYQDKIRDGYRKPRL